MRSFREQADAVENASLSSAAWLRQAEQASRKRAEELSYPILCRRDIARFAPPVSAPLFDGGGP